jgi:uncharacterized protein YukE
MTEKDLIKLKEDCEVAKSETQQLKGQKKAILNQLSEDWNCASKEQGDSKWQKLQKALNELDTKIEEALEALESKYFKA